MHHKGAGMLGSSNYEQGSSWAVEVGSHLKVCSIVVENINKNGQMLVEVCTSLCRFMRMFQLNHYSYCFMISLVGSLLSVC